MQASRSDERLDVRKGIRRDECQIELGEVFRDPLEKHGKGRTELAETGATLRFFEKRRALRRVLLPRPCERAGRTGCGRTLGHAGCTAAAARKERRGFARVDATSEMDSFRSSAVFLS